MKVKNIANAFNQSGVVDGIINFSLGIKGKAIFSCTVNGYEGLYDVHGKTQT